MIAVDLRSHYARKNRSKALERATLPVRLTIPVYWYEIGPGKRRTGLKKIGTYSLTAYSENGVHYFDQCMRKLLADLDRVQLTPASGQGKVEAA